MSEKDIYEDWQKVCSDIVSNKIENFKQLNSVKYMLEHVSVDHGKVYFENLIQNGFDIEYLKQLAALNDTHGSEIINFGHLDISPSTLRYCAHAYDILNLIKSKNVNEVSIVEVGAGYGGLCLILSDMLSRNNITVKNYHILDLEPVQKLQNYYLNGRVPQVCFHDCMNFGADIQSENIILVSCYAISEMNLEYRLKYFENLLPKIKGMYLLWNSQNLEGLSFKALTKMMPEVPQTGVCNSVISL